MYYSMSTQFVRFLPPTDYQIKSALHTSHARNLTLSNFHDRRPYIIYKLCDMRYFWQKIIQLIVTDYNIKLCYCIVNRKMNN